jgi:hypothetical protein
MPIPRLLALLPACCLLLAACAGDRASVLAPAEGISTATLNGNQLTLVSGGGQTGAPGQPLSQPVVVRVTDRRGAPLAGGLLNFIPPSNGGVDPRQARTDAQGYARATWTLGGLGAQALRVSGVGGTLVVTATGQQGSGAQVGLVKRVGDGQQQPAGTLLRSALQVALVRDDGKPVAGALVTWSPSSGTLDRGSGRTSGAGMTHVRWTLGPEGGTQTLTASAPGAQPVTFTATATGGSPRPATLQVLPDSLVVDPGASAALTAVIRDGNGAHIPGLAPQWTSSDAAVATVNSAGMVTGVAEGTARITAKLGALSAFATVRVRPGPASIQVLPDSLVLKIGGSGQLTAVVRDASGAILPGPAPVWSSSSTAVATVNATGQVQGVAAGTARVTATLGALSASATVRVRAAGPSLELFPDSLVLDIGVWGKLFPVVRDAAGRAILGYNLEWSTTSDQVAFPFSDGSVLPLGAGTARVTARLGTLADTVLVRVRPAQGALTIPMIQKRAGYGGIIDASTRPVDLNWFIHVSQAVSAVTMRIRGPGGQVIDCTNPSRVHDREFNCSLQLPRGAEPGVWRVDRVTVTRNGQTTVFTGADLDAMGTLGRAFDVHGTGTDTRPPQVRTLWPHQGTRYQDVYYLSIGIIDHVSGVRGAWMTVRGPGGVTHRCEVSKSAGELAKQGGGVCRLPVQPGSGTWELVTVEVEDGAGNRATYTPQDIARLMSGMSEAPFLVFSFTP